VEEKSVTPYISGVMRVGRVKPIIVEVISLGVCLASVPSAYGIAFCWYVWVRRSYSLEDEEEEVVIVDHSCELGAIILCKACGEGVLKAHGEVLDKSRLPEKNLSLLVLLEGHI